ncbi:baseplate J/gp47 family protein [Paenibacillus glucanolyticus]|uniref:baseplate J/gp47 family protein n=1 Tax=Paenibacillus glucanolyticus TaxID=59843 RepID=UPI0035D622A6
MLNATGFKRKTYADLLVEIETQARSVFGENVNTSARSALGIILRIFAWFLSLLWQDAEDVYHSGYKDSAEGVNLERLGPYVGITKIPEQSATGTIEITGTPLYTVQSGFRITTETEELFETLEDVTLDVSGKGTAPIVAIIPGQSGNRAANSITIIVNPDANVTSVTNSMPTTGGREKETDTEFRARWDQSVAGGGAASLDALRGALLRIENVRAAAVIENNTMVPDGAGRPPKSFQAYILGGDEQVIAETIFKTKSGGIESHGDIFRQVTDLGGYEHTIRFSHAQEVAIQVKVDITKNDSYPADGDEQIRSALVRYVGGEDSGSYYNGLNMGAQVVYTRLISAVYSVEGVEDVTIQVGTNGVFGSENVLIEPYEVAQLSDTDIEVTSHV